jgi:oxygen-independent coproporphyrinogen-3 oxidase
MKIRLIGVAEKDRTAIEHVVRLFFEEPELLPAADDAGDSGHAADSAFAQPAHDMTIELVQAADNAACAVLTAGASEGPWIGEAKRAMPAGLTPEERRRFRKQTLLQALVRALEARTGIEQPWGILTGVRPTKLWHARRRNDEDPAKIRAAIREETLVAEPKLDLMERIVERQLQAVPDLYRLNREVSLYIGIPFCPTKCAYCTFPAYAIGGRQGSVDAFLAGLHYELNAVGRWLKDHDVRVTSVYFGGGTPTSITADEMDRLYEAMYAALPHPDEIREITVEAGRPDTITREKLQVLRKWDIDRISINPQTYTQETLTAIGRHHTVEETIEKVWLAREMGMRNINMDLIIGLPGEGLNHLAHSLEETGKLMPESLTVHTLSFKRASEMTKNRDKYKVADRSEVTAMMRLASEWTQAHGYVPYYLYRQKNILGNLENIGYALPGKESIYNIMIMEEMQSIVGIGCGASSKWIDPVTGAITRTANPKEPLAYNQNFLKCTEEKLAMLDRWIGEERRVRHA